MKSIAVAFLFCLATSVHAVQVHQGAEGLVVIESESTESPVDAWVAKKTVEGYTGECHVEFTGNNPNSGKAHSPLVYHFTVDKDGVYRLSIRAHKRLVGDDGKQARSDQCNDCYVRLIGDFEAGGGAPKAILAADTKMFVHGESAKSWDWTWKLDYHDPKTHKAVKNDPFYNLKAGQRYTLVVSGRSQRFNMDRIVLHHKSVDQKLAHDPKAPASKILVKRR